MSVGHTFPPLPQIGHPETWYATRVIDAEKQGEPLLRDSYKVGQYVSLALDPKRGWLEKLRYIQHALKRYCTPPSLPDPDQFQYFESLANLVRQHAGEEALRMASKADDRFAARVAAGEDREQVRREAAAFFDELMTDDYCPGWFFEEDFAQLRLLRKHWA